MAKPKPQPVNGSTELVEVVPLADLLADPSNLRRHPDRNKMALASSLRRFGAARSVVMDGKNIIRAGNATLEAAQAEGIKTARIIEATGDELIVVRRRDWSDTEATAYGIADNRIGDLSANEWAESDLAATLRALQSEDFDLGSVGYTDGEVEELIGRLANEALAGETVDDPAGEWQGMPEFEHEDQSGVQTINVHFKTREDVQSFAELIGQKISEATRSLWYPEAEIGRIADKRYTDESEVSGLRPDEGEV